MSLYRTNSISFFSLMLTALVFFAIPEQSRAESAKDAGFENKQAAAKVYEEKKMYKAAIAEYDLLIAAKEKELKKLNGGKMTWSKDELKIARDLAKLLYKRGSCYRRMGAWDEAMHDFARCHSFGYKGRRLDYFLGEGYAHFGKYKDALRHLKLVLASPDKDNLDRDQLANVYSLCATAYDGIGDQKNKLDCLDNAISVAEKPARFLKERAFYFQNNKQWQKAVDDFNKCETLQGLTISSYYGRGRCYMELAKYDQAALDFGSCIELEPERGGYYAARAAAYEKSGKKELALADRRKVAEIGEDFALPLRPNKNSAKGRLPSNSN